MALAPARVSLCPEDTPRRRDAGTCEGSPSSVLQALPPPPASPPQAWPPPVGPAQAMGPTRRVHNCEHWVRTAPGPTRLPAGRWTPEPPGSRAGPPQRRRTCPCAQGSQARRPTLCWPPAGKRQVTLAVSIASQDQTDGPRDGSRSERRPRGRRAVDVRTRVWRWGAGPTPEPVASTRWGGGGGQL